MKRKGAVLTLAAILCVLGLLVAGYGNGAKVREAVARGKNIMRIEQVAEQETWLRGWARIVEDDGSTVAYCPDAATARLIMNHRREYT